MATRLAQGQCLDQTRRYRPGSTGSWSGPSPKGVVNWGSSSSAYFCRRLKLEASWPHIPSDRMGPGVAGMEFGKVDGAGIHSPFYSNVLPGGGDFRILDPGQFGGVDVDFSHDDSLLCTEPGIAGLMYSIFIWIRSKKKKAPVPIGTKALAPWIHPSFAALLPGAASEAGGLSCLQGNGCQSESLLRAGPRWTLHAQKGTSDPVVIPASTVRVRCLHSRVLLFFVIAFVLKLWEDDTIELIVCQ